MSLTATTEWGIVAAMKLIWSTLSPEAKNRAVLDHVEKRDAHGWTPDYLTEWDSIQPLLGSDYDIRVRNAQTKVTIYRPSDQWDAWGTTVNEAAMIALLRAAGVEVVT